MHPFLGLQRTKPYLNPVSKGSWKIPYCGLSVAIQSGKEGMGLRAKRQMPMPKDGKGVMSTQWEGKSVHTGNLEWTVPEPDGCSRNHELGLSPSTAAAQQNSPALVSWMGQRCSMHPRWSCLGSLKVTSKNRYGNAQPAPSGRMMGPSRPVWQLLHGKASCQPPTNIKGPRPRSMG